MSSSKLRAFACGGAAALVMAAVPIATARTVRASPLWGQDDLTLDKPLRLGTTVLSAGEEITGRVTYRNTTAAPITIRQLTIAVRAPGGTNSGGPFYDLQPAHGVTTIAAGQSVSLSSGRTLPANATLGTWRAYVTYEDSQGGWHDGNEVTFKVLAALPKSAPTNPAAAGRYTVNGHRILDPNGVPHLFHGVARPSLEWSASGEHLALSDYKLMASWGANVVRIALNQDFWLSKATLHDASYPARIDQQVAWAHQAGLDVILDLHWSDLGDLHVTKAGQQRMADQNSLELWHEIADRYKADPQVLFELYNEPHDVSWDVWLSGGSTGNGSGGTFEAAGMQQLTDAVRSTGAKNLVLVAGLDWAYDLSGVLHHRVQAADVVYVSHTYRGSGHSPSDWDRNFGYLAATDPVIVTEFGSTDGLGDYCSSFVSYAKAKGISWTAWGWFPGGTKFPALIGDWNGTPTTPGRVVEAALKTFNPATGAPK